MDRCRVVPVRPGDVALLLALFDAALGSERDDDRACGACCCQRYALARSVESASLDATAMRAATAARLGVGELDGYLALDHEGRAVGFLDVQPRHRAPHAPHHLGVDLPAFDGAPHDAALVLCLVVHPAHDADAIGPVLIAAAAASLAERGFRVADVLPPREASPRAPHEPGPCAWYEAAGFVPLGENGGRRVMRRELR